MKNMLTRRQLMRGGLAGSLLTGACGGAYDRDSRSGIRAGDNKVFAHGVASGDPLPDRVILWTRVTPPEDQLGSIEVIWQISVRDNFAGGREGTVQTDASKDWTVKVDASRLTPGRPYYYRFALRNIDTGNLIYSDIGRTKALPRGEVKKARFAVVSCANYQWGYFNIYDTIARDGAFDAVLHLGDYFYEQAADFYGGETGKALGRQHDPRHEIVTLDDYRRRHRQYKTDPALQALHAQMPWILIWDDHETANDSWKGGAENHQPDKEGDWEARKRAALQAYYEWMPVREPAPGRTREEIYKNYEWGDLLSLTTLETRLVARDEQVLAEKAPEYFTNEQDAESFKQREIAAPGRQMLGEAQTAFVAGSLAQSKNADRKWRLVANQILMAAVDTPDLNPYISEEVIQGVEQSWPDVRKFIEISKYRPPLYPDCWQGYPWAREQFYQSVANVGVRDLIVLTGDAHEFWANDLYAENGSKMGVELGTSSVSSPTLTEYLGSGTKDYALLVTKENDEVRYYDPIHRGYVALTITKNKVTADMIAVSTVTEPTYDVFTVASFKVTRDGETVQFKGAKGLGLKEWLLYKGMA